MAANRRAAEIDPLDQVRRQVPEVKGRDFGVHHLQGDGQRFPAAPFPFLLLAADGPGHLLGLRRQVGALGQVLSFFNHPGGKSHAGGFPAIPAVGAGQLLQQV